MAIPAKYPGTCGRCKAPIVVGIDYIERTDNGWQHVECATGRSATGAYIHDQVSRGMRQGSNHRCVACGQEIEKGERHKVLYSMGYQARDGHNYRNEERLHTRCLTPRLEHAWLADPQGNLWIEEINNVREARMEREQERKGFESDPDYRADQCKHEFTDPDYASRCVRCNRFIDAPAPTPTT